MPLITRGILFAHIPKTAGTSFRVATKMHAWTWKVYSDYGPDSRQTSYCLKHVFRTGDDGERIKWINWRKTLLAGHFPIKKYIAYYPVHRVISFMRDPVQRLVSHYHDLQRRIDYRGSLEDFVHEERFRNIQSHFFEGIPIEAVGLIGISEFYEESLAMISRLYGLRTPARLLNDNKEKKERVYQLGEPLMEEIRRLNAIDQELYERALSLFHIRRDLMGRNLPYVYGRIERLDENSISGWAVDPGSPDPVRLVVSLNGRRIAVLTADRELPEMKRINLAREGCAGFDYKFDRPLTADDLPEVTVELTGQPISR